MAAHAHELVDRALALIFDELIPLTAGSHDPTGPPSCATCHAVHAALQLRQESGGLRRRRDPAKKRATTTRRPRTPAAAPQGGHTAPEPPVPPETTVGAMERVEGLQGRHETATGDRLSIEDAEARLGATAGLTP